MKSTFLFLSLLLGTTLGPVSAQTPTESPITRPALTERPLLRGEGSARVVLELNGAQALTSRYHLRQSAAGTQLQAGQTDGMLTPQPIQIALTDARPFISAAPVWHGQHLYRTNMTVEVRSSADGKSWSEWQKTKFDTHADDNASRRVGKSEHFEPRTGYVQYRASLSSRVGSAPLLSRLEVVFYSPGETPATLPGSTLAPADASRITATCAKPAVTSRASWGARTPSGTRSYTTVTHLVVHHEEGSNTSSDWAARVRSIESLHIDVKGWSDVGYNYLIDPNGVIYEGRSGGDNVIGAHFCAENSNTMAVCMMGSYTSVLPTTAALNSLNKIMGWKASQMNIDPTGTSTHYGAGLISNVPGHRDNGGCTDCPGNTLYAYLPTVRNNIKSYITNNCGTTPPPTTDTQAPTTVISGPSSATTTFTASFADADNVGVSNRFYQPLEWRTNEWRANRGNGFYNDNFGNSALHADYVQGLSDWKGTWAETTAGTLRQSDVVPTNTAISTFLSQTAGNAYLYHFAAKVNSTSGTRRFGLHIMASDVTVRERGNSYLIWFSLDQQTVSIIETINNVLTPRVSAPVVLSSGTFGDYKVMYSTSTGTVQVFQNNALVASWTDSSPLTSGAHISLRTGTADVEFDDLKVYKSRGTTASITVGNANTNDVRTSGTPGAKIKSLVKDAAHNWSAAGNLDVTISIPAGAARLAAAEAATVYPNPVHVTDGQLTISYGLAAATEVTIVLYDAQGKPLKTWLSQKQAGSHQVVVPARELGRAGTYFVRLEAAGEKSQLIRVQKD